MAAAHTAAIPLYPELRACRRPQVNASFVTRRAQLPAAPGPGLLGVPATAYNTAHETSKKWGRRNHLPEGETSA
jgi:hypothetical protein